MEILGYGKTIELCCMDGEDTLCCSDGYLFASIDTKKQDENPEWIMMSDVIELANTIDDQDLYRHSIFLQRNHYYLKILLLSFILWTWTQRSLLKL